MKNLARIGMMFVLPLSCMFTTSCNQRGTTFTVNIKDPSEQSIMFSNIDLNCTDKEMREHGFLYGDIVTVTAKSKNGKVTKSYDLPYVTNYNEAGTFGPCLCDYESLGRPLGVSPGFDVKEIEENGCFKGGTAEIKMKKADGYYEERNLVRVTTKLTFEECGCENTKYANCRDVINVGRIAHQIKADTLFRGSSPICESKNKGRYTCADEYLKYHKIKNDISLSLSEKQLSDIMEDSKQSKGKYFTELYASGEAGSKVKTVNLGNDFCRCTGDPETPKGGDMIKDMFKYVIDAPANESFFFHCNEGKDRTGFIVMVIEALCGVSLDDLVSDYMLTFCNYYNITGVNNKTKYDKMADITCYRNLYAFMLNAENGNKRFEELAKIDMLNFPAKSAVNKLMEEHKSENDYLVKCATNYLTGIGLDSTQITSIKNRFIYTEPQL